METVDTSGGWAVALVIFIFYFIPWSIAQRRKHKNTLAIFMTNLFLGWTGIGWIAALIWACTANTRPKEPA